MLLGKKTERAGNSKARSIFSLGSYKDLMLEVDPHPLLELHAFETQFPAPLGEMPSSAELVSHFSLAAQAPLQSDDSVRDTIRALLRHGGFKPTGRSKPASEYLIKAAQEGRLASINLAVDACNAVSLHSGLPISVIDVDRAGGPFRVGVAPSGLSYVFNPSGQVMDIGGLLCLFDREGPCANAVKDAERTKTRPETRRTLSLIWSSEKLPGRGAAALAWYSSLLESAGATTAIMRLSR
jgi:DNA/RNA-binding domain of Phe-tRNA-synthetase-like protein